MGQGIAPEQLDQIFEMFAQVKTPLESSHSGLGIGLTLTRSLVEMHGGTVEARSGGIGHGSEFVIRLPLVAGPVGGQEHAVGSSVSTRPRLLVVDDNRDAADSLATLLKLIGHDVYTATTTDSKRSKRRRCFNRT